MMDKKELYETILAFIIVIGLIWFADLLVTGLIWLYRLLTLS